MADQKSNIEAGSDNQGEGFHRSLLVRVRRDFFAGILVTAPIAITLYLTYVFLSFIDNQVAKLIPEEYYPETAIPGIGLLIAIGFFILIGWFARNFLGRMVINFSEYIVDRMPVVNTLYKGVKQIFETIMASQSQAFRDVVMLEYPRKGVWSIGFVTGRSEGEVQRLTAEETINVFVPTTPNPTSGYLLFVPKKELSFLDMTVEEGVKLVISGGIITPPDRLLFEAAADKKGDASAKKAGKKAASSGAAEKRKKKKEKSAG